MQEKTSLNVESVRQFLKQRDFDNQIVQLEDSARTAVEAAQAVGTTVGQIAKSLIFRGKESGKGILVIASGSNRVDEKKVSALLGEKIEKADADFVRSQTGYVIGGVPPIAHAQSLTTLVDEDLFQYSEIWAAAGHPHAVFKLTPAQLSDLTGIAGSDVKLVR